MKLINVCPLILNQNPPLSSLQGVYEAFLITCIVQKDEFRIFLIEVSPVLGVIIEAGVHRKGFLLLIKY